MINLRQKIIKFFQFRRCFDQQLSNIFIYLFKVLSKCSITEVKCRSKKCIFCVTCLSFSLTFIFEIEHIFFIDALDTFCYGYLLPFIIYKQYRQLAQSGTRPKKKVSSNNSNSFTNICLRGWCPKMANRHILSLCQFSLKHVFHRFELFFLYKI